MWQLCKKNLIDNRAKYAHFLAIAAGVIATRWATDAHFRAQVLQMVAGLPHWMQAAIGFIGFIATLFKTTKTLMATEPASGGAQ